MTMREIRDAINELSNDKENGTNPFGNGGNGNKGNRNGQGKKEQKRKRQALMIVHIAYYSENKLNKNSFYTKSLNAQ